ncbi:unnamed protein product [Adineta steineri]|uniref:Uncharacterized protein n=3 Tax=Adineta steineri TaxID=433720 RepID=A0A813YXZ4_9BILA|nr:unnamed protein product [Adineta steineri]
MDEDDMSDKNNCFQVTLTRSPLHGFGISISGGNDDNDNQSLIVSDVIKNGPAVGKLLPNDRIVNVNGHPVVRYMEYTALKLIRESTDFVHLIVQRHKHPVIVSDNELPIKCILDKARKDEKTNIILDCRYYIKKVYYKNNEKSTKIQEGDEIIKINEIPVNRLTLQEAQKLIDKTKEQLILYTIPNKSNNHRDSISSYKAIQSEYNQHKFERSMNNHIDFIRPSSGSRYVSFFTETSSIGIRLAGGNKYGLFICEIQPNSVAYKSGLFISDKIFSVNNIDFTTLTREEAVLYLTNLKTSQVNMIVSNLPHEYEQLLTDVGGDSFYIRAHFTSKPSNDEELSICINDVFHVTDTLYNGQVGYWVATKLNTISSQTKLNGTIPNKSRAEELTTNAPSLDELMKSKRSSFKKKLRSKFTDKRTRSVLSLNHFKEDSIFNKTTCWKPMINSKFPTYERVRLKTITIIRPVVLLGSLADIARDRLLSQYSDQYELPQTHLQSSSKGCINIIKLQSIKDVIQKNRHCLLDISPSAIEQLNYAECYPIVIFIRACDRRIVKQIRTEYGKLYQKSSRRLFETSEYLEHFYSYLFTSIIKLDSSVDWYETLIKQINLQQEQPIWMNYDQLNEKDFLKSDEYFIATKLNNTDEFSIYNKSIFDFDIINKKENNHLQRVASDPAMFQKDQINKTYLTNIDHDGDDDEEYDNHSFMSLPNRCHSVIEMPTTDNQQSQLSYRNNQFLYQRSLQPMKINHNNKDYLFRNDKYINNHQNESKIFSTNSLQINESSPNPNLIRRPLIAPKLRTINSIEQLSSSDSNGSIRKKLLDKSTMTYTEKNPSINHYATWNKPPVSRPTILPKNIESLRRISIENNYHNKSNPLVNSNERFCTESLLKQKMCSSKKHNHTSINPSYPTDYTKSQIYPTLSLQKPRVFTYDDQNYSKQQSNIHSASSGSSSSTLSLKDKNPKEVGETSSYSIQDGCNVIGSARGIMDYYGGKLSCPLTGVSLFVPIGAIREGIQQEIYFQVCQDSSHIEKINGQLLSPIVICGPQGVQFEKPIELILPHSAGNTDQQLSLTLHGTHQNIKTNSQQQNKSLITNGIRHVTNSNVSILVDHF